MSATPATSSVLKVAHHHPGRLRVRAEAFLAGSSEAEHVRDDVERIRGVRSVGHDGRTGSLLVEYAPGEIEPNALIDRIAELEHLDVERPNHRSNAARGIVELFRKVDELTLEVTGGHFDLGVLIPGGLTALSIYSFLKAPYPRIPRWDSLIYWAYSVFLRAHPPPERRSP